jgi:hypothetical protein
MRVVIDTNCLIASVPPNGKYYWLYESFRAGKVKPEPRRHGEERSHLYACKSMNLLFVGELRAAFI